jgi:hypothetical protein
MVVGIALKRVFILPKKYAILRKEVHHVVGTAVHKRRIHQSDINVTRCDEVVTRGIGLAYFL